VDHLQGLIDGEAYLVEEYIPNDVRWDGGSVVVCEPNPWAPFGCQPAVRRAAVASHLIAEAAQDT
jgi:hypothetical protein